MFEKKMQFLIFCVDFPQAVFVSFTLMALAKIVLP